MTEATIPDMTRPPAELAVPQLDAMAPMAVSDRLGRLRSSMDAAGVDALLVTHLTNIRYLTGFTGSAALLLVRADGAWFVTDGRYANQCVDELARAGVTATIEVPNKADDQRVAVVAAAEGAARVGLEASHVSWAQQQRMATTWFPSADLVATEGLVERLRLVKDAGELERMSAAATIADIAFGRLRSRLADRPTEAEFGLELDTEMRRLGAADVSFETIVASGPNGARPHHRPGTRVIEPGDLVVCDFGALVEGYHSDMTRTVWVGEPSSTQRRMFDVVAEAQQCGVDTVRAGVSVGEVDEACRSVIRQAGWSEAFVHSTGHGVGLDIHEEPRVAAGDTVLEAGWVVTVEPGVYLADHGGVRIEDTVVVTDDGCWPLTRAPKVPAV
jgi:Xaa-Pro aminopeptidase